MSAARLLKEARAAGLSISISPAGKLSCRGPAEAMERLKPALAEHRDAMLDELRAECAYVVARLALPVAALIELRDTLNRLTKNAERPSHAVGGTQH